MDYAAIIGALHSGHYSPIYFLQGNEPYFIDSIAGWIEKNALEASKKNFDQYILYGKETSFGQVISTAKRFPMTGGRQVVIIKEAQELKGWNKEENQSSIIKYIENPQPSTVLVFCYKYKIIDKRTKLGKTLGKKVINLESKKMYDNQIPGWIATYAKSKEIKITGKAVTLLSENIGNNIQRLANEIDKVSLNVPSGSTVGDSEIHRYVGISKEYNSFELQAALSNKNKQKAQKIVLNLANNPSENPMVLTLFHLFSFFSKLLKIHHSKARDKNTTAKLIGVHPFFADEYLRATRAYDLTKVIRNIMYIHEADLTSKGIEKSTPSEKDLLRELIFKIID